MNTRRRRTADRIIDARLIVGDLHAGLSLHGEGLLKLEVARPGVRVCCTAGALWLTQPGDLHDHILRAGQSFTLYQAGTVLVQGFPAGKAQIIEPAGKPQDQREDNTGGRRWTRFFNRSAL